jgi:cysteine synthase A
MRRRGQAGSVVTLLCDSADRYRHTYGSDPWLAARGIDIAEPTAVLDRFIATGDFPA